MNKKQNLENAAAVFAKNKNLKQLCFTNDGQAFENAEAAKTHQRELTGSVEGIHLVKNAGYQAVEATNTEDVVKATEETQEEAPPAGEEEEKNE